MLFHQNKEQVLNLNLNIWQKETDSSHRLVNQCIVAIKRKYFDANVAIVGNFILSAKN